MQANAVENPLAGAHSHAPRVAVRLERAGRDAGPGEAEPEADERSVNHAGNGRQIVDPPCVVRVDAAPNLDDHAPVEGDEVCKVAESRGAARRELVRGRGDERRVGANAADHLPDAERTVVDRRADEHDPTVIDPVAECEPADRLAVRIGPGSEAGLVADAGHLEHGEVAGTALDHVTRRGLVGDELHPGLGEREEAEQDEAEGDERNDGTATYAECGRDEALESDRQERDERDEAVD